MLFFKYKLYTVIRVLWKYLQELQSTRVCISYNQNFGFSDLRDYNSIPALIADLLGSFYLLFSRCVLGMAYFCHFASFAVFIFVLSSHTSSLYN